MQAPEIAGARVSVGPGRPVSGNGEVNVAHRLSTVRHAHRIHVLDAVRVVESGSHDGLVMGAGAYAASCRVQTGEGEGRDLRSPRRTRPSR